MLMNVLSFFRNRTFIIFQRGASRYRTHYCNQISLNDVGKDVEICGWVKSVRYNKFMIIRDFYDVLQVFIPDDVVDKANIKNISLESVVKISGTVRSRPPEQVNASMKTGVIEIECKDLVVINEASPSLPLQFNQVNRSNEQVRLKYRYLDLRNEQMQTNLKIRSDFVQSVRRFLSKENFIDIETPTLFRRTPGGAREFLVPTRIDKSFFALTQSPQQFKQLLMVAGFDRYFQIARCYRDEELKADRQPEFTQIDIEMSFVDENDCMDLIERLVGSCWPRGGLSLPFKRMTYKDAMLLYGSDKPDLRFGLEIHDARGLFRKNQCGIFKIDAKKSHIQVFAIKIPSAVCANDEILSVNTVEKIISSELKISKLENSSFILLKNDKGSNLAKYLNESFRKSISEEMKSESNDMVVILAADDEIKTLETLGRFRLAIADHIDSENSKTTDKTTRLLRDPNRYEFHWVVDFPLFTYNATEKRYESTHHPFTAPKDNQTDLVFEKRQLDQILAKHYDLVLNGNEIGGGSIRIHDPKLQKFILTDILDEDYQTLKHLVEALGYGAPPHGGLALGLDRLMALICQTTSIRDVIAFPKSSNGKDLMSDSPSEVSQNELDFYKIKLT
jgi:aspartyl-tRNA synthetase